MLKLPLTLILSLHFIPPDVIPLKGEASNHDYDQHHNHHQRCQPRHDTAGLGRQRFTWAELGARLATLNFRVVAQHEIAIQEERQEAGGADITSAA